jgi:prepilin-type N-terminal cleavage/methylation domain-containing protein
MKQARGFTLIELAIVLVIMTILIGGLAVPLSAQIQAAGCRNQKTLEARRPSRFARTRRHAYLPCPDTDGDGIKPQRSDLRPSGEAAGYFGTQDAGAIARYGWLAF